MDLKLEGRVGVERRSGAPCCFQHGSDIKFGRLTRWDGLNYRVMYDGGRTAELHCNSVFLAEEEEVLASEAAAKLKAEPEAAGNEKQEPSATKRRAPKPQEAPEVNAPVVDVSLLQPAAQ
jgi:hypothetical protein